MQYLMLIYHGADEDEPNRSSPDFPDYMAGFRKFTEEARDKGALVGHNALQDVGTATTVRVRKNGTETTDGPFAETKETLGGYYLLDCGDLDEAIAYAAKIPAARYGSIEIRPILTLEF